MENLLAEESICKWLHSYMHKWFYVTHTYAYMCVCCKYIHICSSIWPEPHLL